jgi:hypothetical protein
VALIAWQYLHMSRLRRRNAIVVILVDQGRCEMFNEMIICFMIPWIQEGAKSTKYR